MIEIQLEKPPYLPFSNYFVAGQNCLYLQRSWYGHQIGKSELLFITPDEILKLSVFDNLAGRWLRKLDDGSVWVVSRPKDGCRVSNSWPTVRRQLLGKEFGVEQQYPFDESIVSIVSEDPMSRIKSAYNLHDDWCLPNGSVTWRKPFQSHAHSRNYLIWETPVEKQEAINLKYLTGYEVPKTPHLILICKEQKYFTTYDLGMERMLFAIADDEMTFAILADSKITIMDLE